MLSPTLRRAAVVLVLLAGGAYFLFVPDDEVGTGLTYVDLTQPTDEPAEEPPTTLSAPPLEPAAPPLDAPLAGEAPLAGDAAPVPSIRISGRVVGFDGAPLADVPITQQHPYLSAAPMRSDGDGAFSLLVQEARGELAPGDDAWLLLGGQRFLDDATREGYLLVLAPRAVWSGIVVDAGGEPLADVALTALAPGDALVRFGIVATPVEHASQHGWSDAEGTFALGPAPRVPGSTLETSLAGYQPASVLLPDDPATSVRVVLRRRE